MASKNERTSPRVASQASRVLRDPRSTARERSVAASALTQARDRKPNGNKK
jgi:hypothetical protein